MNITQTTVTIGGKKVSKTVSNLPIEQAVSMIPSKEESTIVTTIVSTVSQIKPPEEEKEPTIIEKNSWFGKVKNILIGIGKAIHEKNRTPHDVALASKRLEICVKCEQFNATSTITKVYKFISWVLQIKPTEVTGASCKKCACHLPFKTLVPNEKCPLGKW